MSRKPPDGLKLPKITHCRVCREPRNIARIAFVDTKPDRDGITWAVYVCIECALLTDMGKELWNKEHIPYVIGK
jgi:hypothetical protein